MKQVTALKLTCVGAFVATLGVGCASSGYARYDADQTDMDQGVGVSASADVGTGASADAKIHSDRSDLAMDMDHDMGYADTEGEERITVSSLSFSPDTRATWVNRFPFYDQDFRTIEVYTFAVPEEMDLDMDSDSELTASTPEGTVFVEAAGGAGEVRTGRVIQHSPNPR